MELQNFLLLSRSFQTYIDSAMRLNVLHLNQYEVLDNLNRLWVLVRYVELCC